MANSKVIVGIVQGTLLCGRERHRFAVNLGYANGNGELYLLFFAVFRNRNRNFIIIKGSRHEVKHFECGTTEGVGHHVVDDFFDGTKDADYASR